MMMLSEARNAMRGVLNGNDAKYTSVEIDTRRLESDALYFAIQGEKQNGHRFIAMAMQAGAAAVVADQSFPEEAATCHIRVEDTTLALGELARHWRSKFDIPVIGVTGSNGKTTVSQMIATIFAEEIPGISPQGSFNNHWGVPLTLLTLRDHDQSAVIEMGMNHSGELTALGAIVRPTIALITNAAAAHLEGLKSIEGVAKAKGELIDQVPQSGAVILNRDDEFYAQWKARAGTRQTVSFGEHADADIRLIRTQAMEVKLTLNIHSETECFDFPLAGHHNAMNGAAVVAVALAAGVSMASIRSGLKHVTPVNGRLAATSLSNGITVIDDSYNANQASMQAAIEVLSACNGEKILVLGGMGELGERSADIHREMGAYARDRGVDRLLILVDRDTPAYLRDMDGYLSGFGDTAESFTDIETLCASIESNRSPIAYVLVKGSRFAQMERVAQALLKAEVSPC